MQSWGVNSGIKRIAYSDELSDGKPFYGSSNCLPVKALNREPAGHAFHSAALKLRGFGKEPAENSEDTAKNAGNEKDSEYIPSYDSHGSKGKKKKSGKEQPDHYALLGLGNLRYLATEDQIKKSYRDTALKHHPDKLAPLLLAEMTEEAKEAKKEAIEAHFNLIQEAYEILMDPVKRRTFDSTDEFDDEVPSDCAPKDFFKVFGPAFKRNARWSVNSRVPDLGDENTPIREVDKYYNFWYSFKSWREFSCGDEDLEMELEHAESREEKRSIERDIARKTQKAKKEEYARIRSLVDNAYKKDPRILKRKEDEKAKKQQKKDEKINAKKKLEEEAAAAIEEERRRKEEEAKRAAEAAQLQKRIKEKEKKLLRKERSRLRTLSAPVLAQRLLSISLEYVEDLCMSLNTEQLRKLCDKMENKEGMVLAKILKNGNNTEVDDEEVVEVAAKQNGHVEANGFSMVDTVTEKKEKPDSAKAASTASPLSTREEPTKPQENNSTRTETTEQPNGKGEENKNIDNNSKPVAATGSNPDDWSDVQEKALVQALKTFPKDSKQRWERVAEAVSGKSMNQCKKKFKDIVRSKKSTA